jgi:multidrug resistance efflux pump
MGFDAMESSYIAHRTIEEQRAKITSLKAIIAEKDAEIARLEADLQIAKGDF